MTLKVNPPPLQIPPQFISDKLVYKFFTGIVTTLYQVWNSLYGLRTAFKVKTEDATPTAAIRIPTTSGKTTLVVAHLVARRTNGDSAWYQLMGAYKNVSGTMTGIGTPIFILLQMELR
jgi:hypothetical protein